VSLFARQYVTIEGQPADGLGANVTKKDTHMIDIALASSEESATRQVRGRAVDDILVNAITTIRDGLTMAAEGDDPQVLSASTVDIFFAITQTGTISLGVDGELGAREPPSSPPGRCMYRWKHHVMGKEGRAGW
jgi:hypothetical protein